MKYYIIGSGGFAKEVFYLVDTNWNVSAEFAGFIDVDNKEFIIARGEHYPVIKEEVFLETVAPSQQVALFMGIGNPKVLASVANRFNAYAFPNIIHRGVHIDNSVKLGKGNIITAGCAFTVDIEVGSFNIFNLNTTIGHDALIGNANVFNPGCNISGSVKIGDMNLFGTNATILQGIIVGNRSTLGASSLANKNIGDDMVMVGVPAKQLQK